MGFQATTLGGSARVLTGWLQTLLGQIAFISGFQKH
jgi:hypothetical protein